MQMQEAELTGHHNPGFWLRLDNHFDADVSSNSAYIYTPTRARRITIVAGLYWLT